MNNAVLWAARSAGMFSIATKFTASRLRILCYHGIAQENEHRLSPGTFMTRETFAARMDFLKKWGASVIPLEEGLTRLHNRTLPEKAVVITIDDGFFSSYKEMVPVLEQFGFPATVYVSTYYVVRQAFIFDLMVPYLLQEATQQPDLTVIDDRLKGCTAKEIVEFGKTRLDTTGKEQLCEQLAKQCGYDINEARRRRIMMFMNESEVADLHARGVDVQLHTHRHRFPHDDRAIAAVELNENKRSMEKMGIHDRYHFCYPSGIHASWQSEWLSSAGIRSATTTDFGLASASDSAHELPRICDSEAMTLLDFHAAISGFKDVFLQARARSRSTILSN